MVRAIKQTVTVGEGGRIEIPQSELPAGSTAEVIALVEDHSANGEASERSGKVSELLGSSQGQFSGPEEADAYLQKLRDEWDSNEETRRPISYYFGKGKGRGFKDAAEADAFITAERDAWDD